VNFQEGVVIKLGCCANIEDLALGSSRIMVHAYGQKYCCSRYLGTDAAVKACFISLPISSPAPALGRNPVKAAKRGCYFPLFLTIQLPISGWFPPPALDFGFVAVRLMDVSSAAFGRATLGKAYPSPIMTNLCPQETYAGF